MRITKLGHACVRLEQQGVAHATQVGPLELPDRRDREVALRAVDHLVRDQPAAGPLEHPLASVRQLELGWDPAGELDQLTLLGAESLEQLLTDLQRLTRESAVRFSAPWPDAD